MGGVREQISNKVNKKPSCLSLDCKRTESTDSTQKNKLKASLKSRKIIKAKRIVPRILNKTNLNKNSKTWNNKELLNVGSGKFNFPVKVVKSIKEYPEQKKKMERSRRLEVKANKNNKQSVPVEVKVVNVKGIKEFVEQMKKIECSDYSENESRKALVMKSLVKFMMHFTKGGPIINGLTENVWLKVLELVSVSDLKNLRLVSPSTNYLVEKSLSWAVNVCFLYNETCHEVIGKRYEVCPLEMICEDSTLGWPDIRLSAVRNPFSAMKFWKKSDVRNSIRTLELKNCLMTGLEVLEILCCLPSIKEFLYSFDPGTELANKAVSKLLKSLDDAYDIWGVVKKSGAYKKSKKKCIYRIGIIPAKPKKIVISAPSLELINIILAILEQTITNSLKELRIICISMSIITPILEEKIPNPIASNNNNTTKQKISKQIPKVETKSKITLIKDEVRASKLIENNQETLKTLEISFYRKKYTICEEVGMPLPFCLDILESYKPPIHMIAHLLCNPPYKKLSLKELIIDVPNLFPSIIYHHEKINDICACCVFRRVLEFCQTQKELKRLRISRVNITIRFKPNIQKLRALQNEFTCNVELGGSIEFGDVEKFVPKWEDFQSTLTDIYITCNGNESQPLLSNFMDSTMPVMDKLKKFELTSEKKDLEHFELSTITLKFPNLTRLLLADVRVRSDGLRSSPKITDKDFQQIFMNLKLLVELVIKANMSTVSDFGLTGLGLVPNDVLRESEFTTKRKSNTHGIGIESLPYLETLELHGLGNYVTDVTAYEFKNTSNLRELYLFSPKFSPHAMKYLQDLFDLREGSKIYIN